MAKDAVFERSDALSLLSSTCLGPGACRSDSHTVIDDYRREINYNESRTICDMDLVEGWYRFLLNGTNAVIPTSCVEVRVHTVTHNTNTWTDTAEPSK